MMVVCITSMLIIKLEEIVKFVVNAENLLLILLEYVPNAGGVIMKSIISANIKTELAKRLKKITKGARSRTIERALEKYLDEKDNFVIEDIETLSLILELGYRKDIPDSAKQYLRALYLEIKSTISDE